MPNWRRCSTTDDTTDIVREGFAAMQSSNGITTSTQSFGITPEPRRPVAARQKRRFCFLGLAGVLIAFAGGFVLGYFLEKNSNDQKNLSSDGNTKRNSANCSVYNCTDPWLMARMTEQQLVSKLDRHSLENFSRYVICV